MASEESTTTGFDIALFPESVDSGAYRGKNAASEVHRHTIIPRNSRSLSVQARLALVVHGTLSTGRPASLIVINFDFISRASSQRFKYAMIDITFKPLDPGSPCPSIVDIAPHRYEHIQRTGRTVKHTDSLGASLSVQAGGVSTGGNLEWASSKESEDTQAIVAGSLMMSRDYGDYDSANWILRENRAKKIIGIPTQLQVAILLKRDEEEPDAEFMAVVEVKTEVNLHDVVRLFGKTPRDDPIIFDPTTANYGPKSLCDSINLKRLDDTNLDDLKSISSDSPASKS